MAAICRRLCSRWRSSDEQQGTALLDSRSGSSLPSTATARDVTPNATAKDMLVPEKCFYMNFKLLNIAEAFPKIARAKSRSNGRPDAVVSFTGAATHVLASRPKFGRNFSNTLADKLTGLMPHMLEEKGINFKLSKVHCGDAGFIVLRAEVVDVDLLKLLESAKGTDFAAKLSPLIGLARWFADVDAAVVPKVQKQMMLKLEKDIPDLIYAKARLRLLMICKPSSEQADFFFDALAAHKVEVEFEILNREEVVPRIAKERTEGYFGTEAGKGKYLGKAAGVIASYVVAGAPESIFGKLIARRMSRALPQYLTDAGVTMLVLEAFAASDQSGRTILRCELLDVDLEVFRKTPGGTALAASMAQGQHMLKLGHKGRTEVYEAVRNHILIHFRSHLLENRNVRANVIVRDVQLGGPPKMLEIEGFSDSDDGELDSRDHTD